MTSSSESYLPSSSLSVCDNKLAPIRAGTCLLQRPKSTLWHLNLQLAYNYFKGNRGLLMFYNSIAVLWCQVSIFFWLSPCCDESGSERALIDRPNPNEWPEVACRELPNTYIKAHGFAGHGTWQSILPSHSKMQAEAQQNAHLPSFYPLLWCLTPPWTCPW